VIDILYPKLSFQSTLQKKIWNTSSMPILTFQRFSLLLS